MDGQQNTKSGILLMLLQEKTVYCMIRRFSYFTL